MQQSTIPTSLPDRTAEAKHSEASSSEDIIYAIVDYEDAYVQPIILAALQALIPPQRLRLLPADTDVSSSSPSPAVPEGAKLLQIRAYEALDFDRALSQPATSLVNSYVIRKALIRKHFLSTTVEHWVAKHPGSVLASHVRRGEALEVDYAEFLEDALVEAWDLRASLERNEGAGGSGAAGEDREWWILKPSMSDRGQGIRLFSTMGELQDIFDGWEADEPSSDEEEEGEGEEEEVGGGGEGREGDEDGGRDYITTSHLRHFVAQPYIHPPLLLPSCGNRKFHIRTYVLCAGAMRVYVCREMLALFAARPYAPPWEKPPGRDDDDDKNNNNGAAYLDAHLTNTCLQGERADALSVQRFWALDDEAALPRARKEAVFAQVCAAAGELFEAAARGMPVHFQPLPCAFEAYGLDFLVDADGTAWLLEVNAFPDFRQTGERLRDAVVAEFWRGAVRWGVGPWAGVSVGGEGEGEGEGAGGDEGMVLVRDVDLGRR